MKLTSLRAAVVAGVFVGFSSAHAESSPYYIGVIQKLTHTDNVGSARPGSERSDNISVTGIRLGLDQPIGRQRLGANFTANHNRYNNTSTLTNTDYTLNGRWDFDTVERVSGVVSLSSSQSLPSESQIVQGKKNTQRVDQAVIQASLGNVTMWTFDAGLAYSRSSFAVNTYTNSTQFMVNAGAQVTPASGLTLRTGVRHSAVKYPNINNDVSRNDLDLSATINPGGASSYTSRLSYTKEQHSLSNRNSSSWTGALGWNWRPTGKFSTSLNLSRDTSNGNFDFGASQFNIDSFESRLNNRLSLSANWAATSKINLTATVSHLRRDLDNAWTVGSSTVATSESDNQTTLSLNAKYALMRNVDLGCNIGRTERTVTSATSTLTHPFTAVSFGCYGQAVLDY